MKFCKVSLFFALLVAVCLPAVAQTAIMVNIPFDFVAAGKTLPAGHYTVKPAFHSNNAAWIISNRQAGAGFLSNSVESAKAHGPSLVFLQAGGAYSLIQVWTRENSGREVLRSNVKQTLVSEGDKKQYVEIAAE
jgi:hypothetical protein